MRFYTDCFRRGNQLFLTGYEDGNKFRKKIKYEPHLFVRSDDPMVAPFQSVNGDPLKPLYFDTMSDARKWTSEFSDVSNFKKEFWGSERWVYNFLHEDFPEEIQYNKKWLKIGNLDIEVFSPIGNSAIKPSTATEPVSAITVEYRGTYFVFHYCAYQKHRDDVVEIRCKDEVDLLTKFLRFWRNLDLDIVTGWNCEFFDVPYLVNRIKNVLGEAASERMSPYGIVETRSAELRFGKVETIYKLKGLAILDYMQLYKEFSHQKQERYTLDHIAYVELKQNKMKYQETSLHELYLKNPQTYIEYNIRDVELLVKLDLKLAMIELALSIAYTAKINPEDCFTSVLLWDVIITNYMYDKGIAVNRQAVSAKDSKYQGAYVRDPVIGIHSWVSSFDVKGLYPSLIVMYNMSPETYAGMIQQFPDVFSILADGYPKVSELDMYAVAANGTKWKRDKKGIFPELVEKMTVNRDDWKNSMKAAKGKLETAKADKNNPDISKYQTEVSKCNNMQAAFKVILNSLYGAIGNAAFRWFMVVFAEAITLSGQYIIQYVGDACESYLRNVMNSKDVFWIATDTDSVYLQLNPLVEKFCKGKSVSEKVQFVDDVCKKRLEPLISKKFDEIFENSNAYSNFLKMKREIIAERGVWKKKKNYALKVWDDEGTRYSEPELKVIGLQAVRSSTPEVCRGKFKEALNFILNGDQDGLHDMIDSFRTEFDDLEYEDIASPIGCNNLEEYSDEASVYKSKCPIQVRGALLFNKYLVDMGLETRYDKIKEGDKIKFCYLKRPNPIKENVISTLNFLPREMGFEKYIDYQKQFETTFLKPIQDVCDAVGWTTEDVTDLSDLF